MTDVSSASATGFYDPFTMQWAGWGITMLKIPRAALPEVVDTAGDHFTSTLPSIWGHPIRIISCVSYLFRLFVPTHIITLSPIYCFMNSNE